MRIERNTLAAALIITIIPSCGVLAARYVGAAPRAAEASAPITLLPVPSMPPYAPADPITAEGIRTPFRSNPVVQPAPELPEFVETAPARGDPTFTVTSIMPHPTRPLALINARPRMLGDEIAPGWRLTAFPEDQRSVVLTGPEGQQVRVRMNR